MLFLLNIVMQPRPDRTPEQRGQARERENSVALDLMQQGTLRRMFRCAGSNESYSIWEAASPEDLDAALRSLPNFPSIAIVKVTPLIKHPVEEAYERERGPVPPL